MDTKELLNAKKELEERLLVAINNEINSFHNQTGLTIDEISIHFARFVTIDGIISNIEKVTCRILL